MSFLAARPIAALFAVAIAGTALGGCGGGGGTSSGAPPVTPPAPPPPPAQSTADFRDEVVYQLLTDRFANGNAANDNGDRDRAGDTLDPTNPIGWHGGDFDGIRRKIEEGYFQSMGFTAIWISPVVRQVAPPGNGGGINSGRPFVGFHGYWADDFGRVEPHFGDLAALRALGEAADAAGIRLVIDVVVNHAGPGSRLLSQNPSWFRTGSQCGSDEVTGCLAGLPDFRQELRPVTDYLLESIRFLRDNVSVDGFRMDTMKHVGDTFWSEYFAAGSPAAAADVWTVGEVFDGSVARMAHYLDAVGSPSVFDFPLKFAITDSLARGGSVRRMADVFAQDNLYDDPTRLATFIDNHDVWRFTSEAEAAGMSPAEADRRLDMALTLIYAARGIPVVYYGTEIGMRGQGASYDKPLGASSREDMDFSRLAASAFDERLAVLAEARRSYPALRRGAQRTLAAPGVSCAVAPSGLDPAADFGDTLFVRGSFDGWANPPPASQSFVNQGGRRYQAAVELPAGQHQFKVAAADWSPEFANVGQTTLVGVPITLSSASGAGSNSRMSIAAAGCYGFELNAQSTTQPVLTVVQWAAGVDPDVFAFARTMTGERSVVTVLNNGPADVELAALSGGIDVQGLLPDGPVMEITGATTGLVVSAGRLIGPVPALTALAVTAR